MIVTRTETYTDWIFSGAHSNEVEATVGKGLMVGYIYFRYAYDVLQQGETVEREVSFVHLSDGSTYELGSGLSSEKINITYNGQTAEGLVSLTVSGNSGVGVSSITRNLTIAYDDGKVPVLDTDQLEGILQDLKGSLSESIKDTADTVKNELKGELQTTVIELRNEVQEHVSNHSQVIENKVDGKISEVNVKVSSVDSKVDTLGTTLTGELSFINGKVDTLTTKIDTKYHAELWGVGQYTATALGSNNLLEKWPSGVQTSPTVFQYIESEKALKLSGGASDYNRIVRLCYTSSWQINDENAEGYVYFTLSNHPLSNYAMVRQVFPVMRKHRLGMIMNTMQVHFEMFIPKKDSTHPLLNRGVRILVENLLDKDIIMLDGGTLSLSLITSQ